jgi:hypothetical protein
MPYTPRNAATKTVKIAIIARAKEEISSGLGVMKPATTQSEIHAIENVMLAMTIQALRDGI